MELRRATIDLSAIAHNFNQIKQLVPGSNIIAVIKSNAYGHGLVTVAKTLANAEAFGVSVIGEALALRAAGITQKIILMTGVYCREELESCVKNNIDIVVHQHEHIEMLSALQEKECISVWLKLDVGMHRLGFEPSEISDIFQQLNKIPAVRKPVYLMSHLPNAGDLNDPYINSQIHLFKKFQQEFQVQGTLAKSSGILAWPNAHFQWVRPGIMLYGISPLVGYIGSQHGLIPAMDFTSIIVAVRHLHAGDRVSYGGDWVCPEDMVVGIVGVGYSSGYPRHAKAGTPVLVNGKRCGLIGRVCMDMIAVDCRHYPEVKLGDQVTLWGKDLPIEWVADQADTIAYELICHVSPDVKQYYE